MTPKNIQKQLKQHGIVFGRHNQLYTWRWFGNIETHVFTSRALCVQHAAYRMRDAYAALPLRRFNSGGRA